jgi:hypothetical protein
MGEGKVGLKFGRDGELASSLLTRQVDKAR